MRDTRKLRVLDVCAGTGSATQAFRDRGHEVETLDIIGNHTYIYDVRVWQPKKHYDFIWASPPCTCFSIAGVSHHWMNYKPHQETLEAIEILKACVGITSAAPLWVIENPMGMMRTLPIMKELRKRYFRSTVTYCQYGDTAMKPTDLWHNLDNFHPKRCKNNDKCHVNAPRGMRVKGSTQWKSKTDKSKVPYGLSLEICKAVENACEKRY